jgi:hypothetical protein
LLSRIVRVAALLQLVRVPMLLVLENDRARVAVGNLMLVAQPVDPVVEAQKARTLLDLVEPLWEPAAGDLRNPLDEVAVRLLGVVHGHERLHGLPNS